MEAVKVVDIFEFGFKLHGMVYDKVTDDVWECVRHDIQINLKDVLRNSFDLFYH